MCQLTGLPRTLLPPTRQERCGYSVHHTRLHAGSEDQHSGPLHPLTHLPRPGPHSWDYRRAVLVWGAGSSIMLTRIHQASPTPAPRSASSLSPLCGDPGCSSFNSVPQGRSCSTGPESLLPAPIPFGSLPLLTSFCPWGSAVPRRSTNMVSISLPSQASSFARRPLH